MTPWADTCPACKGYPGQEHDHDRICFEPSYDLAYAVDPHGDTVPVFTPAGEE